jgi:hypothetical protein
MSKIFSFAGLAVSCGIAIGCDRWVKSLRTELSESFNLTSFIWQSGLANLLLAVELVLITWYVLFWANRSRFVATAFLLIGLLVIFSTALGISYRSTIHLSGIDEFLTPSSHVVYTAAFGAALGLAGLVLPIRAASGKGSQTTTSSKHTLHLAGSAKTANNRINNNCGYSSAFYYY